MPTNTTPVDPTEMTSDLLALAKLGEQVTTLQVLLQEVAAQVLGDDLPVAQVVSATALTTHVFNHARRYQELLDTYAELELDDAAALVAFGRIQTEAIDLNASAMRIKAALVAIKDSRKSRRARLFMELSPASTARH